MIHSFYANIIYLNIKNIKNYNILIYFNNISMLDKASLFKGIFHNACGKKIYNIRPRKEGDKICK